MPLVVYELDGFLDILACSYEVAWGSDPHDLRPLRATFYVGGEIIGETQGDS